MLVICDNMLDGTCDPSAFCCTHAKIHERESQCDAPLCGETRIAVKCVEMTEKRVVVMRLLYGVKLRHD